MCHLISKISSIFSNALRSTKSALLALGLVLTSSFALTAQASVVYDFEDNTVEYPSYGGVSASFATQDDAGVTRNMLKLVNGAGAEWWSGVTIAAEYVDSDFLGDGSAAATMRVYAEQDGNLNLELEANGHGPAVVNLAVTQGWNDLSFDFSGADAAINWHKIQIRPDALGQAPNAAETIYYIDDLSFPNGTIASAPVVTVPASPVPTDAADSVLSIFSDAYTDLEGTNFNPGWGQATQVTVADGVITYAGLNYQGTEFTSSDVSGYEYIHLDFFTNDATDLQFTIISPGKENLISLTDQIVLGQWVSVEIPLTDYIADLTSVFQFKVVGNGNVVLDNLYFGGVAAPVDPTTKVNVTFQVNMDGVDTANGVSVMGGAVFGQAGLAMSDDDGDNVWTVTTELDINTTVAFKYRNTTALTWDGQEPVSGDCTFGEWNDRQVVVAEEDITLDVVSFGSCTGPDTTVSFTATLPEGTTSARLHSDALGWDVNHADGVATDNGDGTWTATIPAPWAANANYKWIADGVEENLKDDVDAGYCANDGLNSGDWGANRVYSGSGDVTGQVFGECSDTPAPDTTVSFTVTLPAGTTSARLHSEAFGWDVNHPDGVATDNGDGTWTATIPAPWAAGTNYKWFVDGAEENLKDDVDAGYCANDGLNSGDWGANRLYSGSGDVTGQVFGECSDTPAPVAQVNVTFQVNMDGVDTTNGVSVMGGAVFGQAGVAMSDDDGDNIWTVTTALNVNSTVAFKYRNTTALTWDGQEPVSGDCTFGEWNDRQVDVADSDITLDVVAFGNCDNPIPAIVFDFEDNTVEYPSYGGVSASFATQDDGGVSRNMLKLVNGMGAEWWSGVTIAAEYVDTDFLGDGTAPATMRVYAEQDGNLNLELEANGHGPAVVNTAVTQGWNDLSFDFSGTDAAVNWHKIQIRPDALGQSPNAAETVYYIDDITFPGATIVAAPVVTVPASPVPTDAADSVLSIFSDAYTDLAGTDFNPGWGQATQVTVADGVITYAGLNYQGTQFANSDVSGYGYIHLDFYTTDATDLQFTIISPGKENLISLTDQIVLGQWVSVEIALTDYIADLADIFQFKVVGNGTVVLDNLYFGGTAPAPADTGGDGVVDTDDAFPNDATETADTDGDGVGDNADVFPNDASETVDTDGDGVGDNSDYAPNDGAVQSPPVTNYCATEVTHFNIAGHPHAILLTVENSGADSITVTASPSDGNAVDVLMIQTIDGGGTAAETTFTDGVATSVVSWAAGTMPATTSFTMLWSDDATPGNMMVNNGASDDGLGYVDTAYVCPVDTTVSFTVTLPAGTTSARLHSEAFGWDVNHPDGVATDNGDGTWTATIPAPWAAGTNYKWFVDGAEENLKDDVDAGYCANDGLNSGDWGANRLYSGSGDVTGQVFGECSDTPAPPAQVNVTFQVVMDGVDTTNGVSVMGGAVFGQAGVAMSDDDGDNIWTVTTALNVNSTVAFKYRNTTALTWDGQEPVSGDCTFGEWNDRQVDVADADITLDAVAFGKCGYPAPEPTEAADSVLSVFGTTYGNLAGTNFDPNWGQATDAVAGDEYVLNNLNYQGVSFDGGALNVSGYEYLHVDYYTEDSTAVNVFLISPGPSETPVALDVSVTGKWNSVDIPLSSFTAVNLAEVIQMKFDGNGTIRLDNMYFGGEAPLSPWDFDGNGEVDALTDGLLFLRYAFQLRDDRLVDASVVATDSTLSASEIQARIENVLSVADIDNNGSIDPLSDGLLLLRYMFDITGESLVDGVVDLDCGSRTAGWQVAYHIENVHDNYASDPSLIDDEPTGCALQLFLSGADDASEVRLTGPWWGWDPNGGPVATWEYGAWVVTFDPAPDANMEYLWIVDGVQENLVDNAANGECDEDGLNTDYANYANRMWMQDTNEADAVYDACSNTGMWPEADATDPTEDSATVLSVFGATYGNLAGTNFDPDWGQATDAVVGDHYVLNNLNYQGVSFDGGALDVSAKEYLHIDYFSGDSSMVKVFLISPGPNENSYRLDTSVKSQWVSVDIPLTDFSPVDLTNVIQMKFEGNGTIYIDNMYFGGGTAPVDDGGSQDSGLVFDFEDSSVQYPGYGGVSASHATQDDAGVTRNMLKLVNGAGSAWWSGVTLSVLPTGNDFLGDGSAPATMRVYAEQDGNLNLELEADGNAPAVVNLAVTQGWNDLSFDFSGADAAVNWRKIQIRPDALGQVSNAAETIYYIDDVTFPNASILDSDGDGASDLVDDLPNDPTETVDSDGDGVGDNADELPNDPAFSTQAEYDAAQSIPAAPTPTDAADSVLSIFSDAYTDLEGTNFNPGWGQATQVTVDDVLTYSGLNYQGTEFNSSDVSGYGYIHLDFYTSNATDLQFTIISPGKENLISLTDQIVLDQWVSVEIPLTDFVADLTSIFQFKVVGNGNVLLDNLYFGGVGVPVDPTAKVNVTFQVNMDGVDTTNGVSVMGGAVFGQAGLDMSDDDGDNVWSVTTALDINTTVAFKYRNTTALTWDGQEPVAGDCTFGQWNDRQVNVVEDDITLDVVAFGSCGNP